ncbi:protein transporter [Coprinopsis marcescibilis]|uniref:Protein transporter n=1 Tax=Coprinopsis marcescibilis TaxID=230819 RepID=A0A5C3L9J5_COPMA|nr:protein transporter [Coprinopsis marcescibilis]
MDAFDDLLAPSRQALESNPFASPFDSNRSGSPDPWASPFASQTSNDPSPFGTSHGFEHNPFSSGNPYESPSAPTFEAAVREDLLEEVQDTTPEPIALQEPSDPLDSAAANSSQDEEEDNRPLGLRTPGFRESIAPPNSFPRKVDTDLSHTPTRSRTPEIQPLQSPNNTVAPPSAIQAHHIQQSALSRSSTPLASPLVAGVLENTLESSLGGLSLGADVLGGSASPIVSRSKGWQDDDSAWGRTDLPTAPIVPVGSASAEDSDDDKPISQTLKRSSVDSANSVSTPTKMTDNSIPPVSVITVDDPQKVGDPLRPYIMYTVHTRTTSPLFQKSAFSVLRRYSDFVWLYETLCYNNPGVVVPPVPDKSSFGRFEDQFVRQRRLGLEKCIQKIANHPNLAKDPDLQLFLESDTFALDIKHRKPEGVNESKGLIASIGQTFTGPRFHETDEWFDRQRMYLDSLESQLRGLAKSIELVARHRSDIAIATGDFAQTVADLSSSDVGKQLSHALAELAEVQRKAQELQNTQAEQDMSTLMATTDEYARLINSVRAAFSSRIRVYNAWKTTESDLIRTKQTHEKNRAQGRIPAERLGYSLNQIAEAERRAGEAKREYDQVSKLVKSEMARFEQERIEDFKDTLHAFLEGMISRQKELITCWENYQQLLLKRVGGGGPTAARSVEE